MEDAVLEWRSRPGRSEPAADRRIGTGTINDYETHCLQASLALDHKRRLKQALHHAAKHYRANCTLDNLFGSGDVERTQQKDQPALFGTLVL